MEDDAVNPSENPEETQRADDVPTSESSSQGPDAADQEPFASAQPTEGDAKEETFDQPSVAQSGIDKTLARRQTVTDEADTPEPDEPAAPTSGTVPTTQAESQPQQRLSKDEKLDLLVDVPLTITAELGRTVLSIADILNLDHGSVIELDRAPADPVDLLVNGQIVANGEVVVVDDKFGIRIVNIINPAEGSGNKSARLCD